MNRFARWFGQPRALADAAAEAVDRWRAIPGPAPGRRADVARLVVVDVESSGLDPVHDRLLAIGAVALEGGALVLAQSFEVVLQQTEASSADNILVHGIGGDAQRAGAPSAAALGAFLDFARRDPLLAFHAPFDRTLIERALRAHLGLRFAATWLDLAWLAPAVCGERGNRESTLDHWLAAFDIENAERHNALADATATAQLALAVLARAAARGLTTVEALHGAAEAQHWLGRR
ncbi:MAG: 3'-5' exonuclease [Burkholderiales bacterium]